MSVLEKIVKKDKKGRAYLRCKIEYKIKKSYGFFYSETDIVDYLENNEDLKEVGFIYALYCLIGKAFCYLEFNLKLNPDIVLLKKFLEKNKILDGNAGIKIEKNIFEVCEKAYKFLVIECALTDSDLAFIPEILLDYLNNELTYYA